MQKHIIKRLVLIISECVPSTAGQNTIINAIQRQAVAIAARDGQHALIAYLASELRDWEGELKVHRQKKRQEVVARRTSTTLNLFTALLAVTPTLADFLIYIGYLPI